MQTERMSYETFRHFLSELLGIAEPALTPEAHFLGDLSIESLKMVELVLQIEKKLGIKVSTDAAWEIETVQDAYDFYLRHLLKNDGRSQL